MSTKKRKINFLFGIFSLIILIVLGFFFVKYIQYKTHFPESFVDYRTRFGKGLYDYYCMFYQEPKNFEDFNFFLEKQYSDKNNIKDQNFMQFVSDQKDNMRIKYIPDSNLSILYHIGFDGIDDKYEKRIIDLDHVNYAELVINKEGDIAISYSYHFDICKNIDLDPVFYTEGYVSDNYDEMISIYYEEFLPEIIHDIQSLQLDTDGLMLYKIVYRNSHWKASLRCNSSNLSANHEQKIKNLILEKFNYSDWSQYIDSLYIPVIY